MLVNNAGIWQPVTTEETTDGLWLDTLAINLSIPFFLSRAALPLLRLNRGAIVNIASSWGLHGAPKAAAYCASKGGLVLMTRAMSIDHAAEGVRINAVCPGDVATPMLFRDAEARGIDPEAALREANAGSQERSNHDARRDCSACGLPGIRCRRTGERRCNSDRWWRARLIPRSQCDPVPPAKSGGR